jgi:hypothetical protein
MASGLPTDRYELKPLVRNTVVSPTFNQPVEGSSFGLPKIPGKKQPLG